MSNIITIIDLQLLHIIHNIATPELDSFFRYLTKATELKYMLPLLLLFMAYKRTRKIGLHIFLSELLQIGLGVYFLKPLIARPRPFLIDTSIQLAIKAPGGFSCPSGHSGTAFAFAFALFFLDCPKYVKVIALIFATVVGFSRLYFQVHYPTDVLLGAVLGCVCGASSSFMINFFNDIRNNK